MPAIRAVLEDAIKAGGSSLRDYRHADGELGAFQHAFCVYGREGEPCLRKGCGGIVRRIVQAGRSTFYCPTLPALGARLRTGARVRVARSDVSSEASETSTSMTAAGDEDMVRRPVGLLRMSLPEATR